MNPLFTSNSYFSKAYHKWEQFFNIHTNSGAILSTIDTDFFTAHITGYGQSFILPTTRPQWSAPLPGVNLGYSNLEIKELKLIENVILHARKNLLKFENKLSTYPKDKDNFYVFPRGGELCYLGFIFARYRYLLNRLNKSPHHQDVDELFERYFKLLIKTSAWKTGEEYLVLLGTACSYNCKACKTFVARLMQNTNYFSIYLYEKYGTKKQRKILQEYYDNYGKMELLTNLKHSFTFDSSSKVRPESIKRTTFNKTVKQKFLMGEVEELKKLTATPDFGNWLTDKIDVMLERDYLDDTLKALFFQVDYPRIKPGFSFIGGTLSYDREKIVWYQNEGRHEALVEKMKNSTFSDYRKFFRVIESRGQIKEDVIEKQNMSRIVDNLLDCIELYLKSQDYVFVKTVLPEIESALRFYCITVLKVSPNELIDQDGYFILLEKLMTLIETKIGASIHIDSISFILTKNITRGQYGLNLRNEFLHGLRCEADYIESSLVLIAVLSTISLFRYPHP